MNGLSSAQTVPEFPSAGMLPDADLWEHYRALGLSPEQATQHVERRRSGRQAVADNPLAPTKSTSPGTAALLGAGRGATSGFLDELVGALQAFRGPEPQNTAQRLFGAAGGRPLGPAFDPQQYAQTRDLGRELQSQAFAEHPAISIGGQAVGSYINPLNYLLGPATKGMGAVRQGIATGATLGAAQGAGEGTSGIDRLAQALQLAAGGAVIGGAGGVANKLWRALFRKAPSPKISEAAVRAQLAKLGFKPDEAEQAVGLWRQGGILPTPKPTPPPTLRPGETIVQTSPKGFEVTGTRATPTAPTTPTLAEMQGFPTNAPTKPMPDIGRGQTLPYYPRGGKVEQSFGAQPVTSGGPSPLIPQQLALLKQFLQGATPADLPGRLDVIRAIGIPLPPDAEAQLLQVLTKGAQ